ncbi:hypothetical protein HanXRQr2_Chr15g0705691 [Helianthus annuus]|uniref:Uncharacterized protein n=1 Tax=Helianthus annuus TaxID=4232 RepID=A0A9K3E2J2_HELAN|nr:hypothetical protein HanXRQr2_Chr15g0705691 [Helianthus annuus]KAJ0832312.1 hypothetical protein HanPSC8_Chr15g0677331 [Helianthus annuus]
MIASSGVAMVLFSTVFYATIATRNARVLIFVYKNCYHTYYIKNILILKNDIRTLFHPEFELQKI